PAGPTPPGRLERRRAIHGSPRLSGAARPPESQRLEVQRHRRGRLREESGIPTLVEKSGAFPLGLEDRAISLHAQSGHRAVVEAIDRVELLLGPIEVAGESEQLE